MNITTYQYILKSLSIRRRNQMLHWFALLCQRGLAALSGAVAEFELFGESDVR